MSENIAWQKGHKSDTKYPKKAFNAVLQDMYPSRTDEKGTPLIRLDFEDGKSISLFGLKVEESEIKTFSGLDAFLESLETLGIEDYWGGVGDDDVLGFKTEPDIRGCRLWMKPLEEETIGNDEQTRKSVFWGTLVKYEMVPAKKPSRPGKLPPKAQTKDLPVPSPALSEPTAATELADVLMSLLQDGNGKSTPKSISELFVAGGKKYTVSQIRAELESWGNAVVKQGDKYIIV